MKYFLIILTIIIVNASHAQYSVSNYFHRVGPSESLTVRFDHSIEATTTRQYNGYISLHFEGYGYNNPSEGFDAFWYFFNASAYSWQPIKQGLGIAFDGSLTISGNRTLYEKDLANNTDVSNPHNSLWQIVYNNNVGLYDGLNVYGIPDYRTDHEYDVVLLINSDYPRTLNFGFLDGGLQDNCGQVNVTIIPVEVGAVPEPSTITLLVIGLLLLLCTAKHKH